VLLDHDADFQTYKWLDKQADLRVVHRWPDLTLYENTERTAPGWFPFSGVTLPDWGALIGAASQSPLTDYSITVSRPAAGPARPWRLPPTTPAVPALALDRKPYKEELEPAGPVHGHPVGITTTLSSEPGWRIDSRPAESWAGVTIAGRPAGLNVAVRQGHWTATFISELASLCALVLTVVGVAAFTVRSRRRSSSG
jgi:hypothetical protein